VIAKNGSQRKTNTVRCVIVALLKTAGLTSIV
jgi:hypothetical protein